MNDYEMLVKIKEKKEINRNIISIIIFVLSFVLVFVYVALSIWVPIPFRGFVLYIILLVGIFLVLTIKYNGAIDHVDVNAYMAYIRSRKMIKGSKYEREIISYIERLIVSGRNDEAKLLLHRIKNPLYINDYYIFDKIINKDYEGALQFIEEMKEGSEESKNRKEFYKMFCESKGSLSKEINWNDFKYLQSTKNRDKKTIEILKISRNSYAILFLLTLVILFVSVIKLPYGTDPDSILCKYYPVSERNYVKIYDDQNKELSLKVYLDKNLGSVYYCLYKIDSKKVVLKSCFRSLPPWIGRKYDKEITRIEKKLNKQKYTFDEMVIVSLYEITETENYKKENITFKEKITLTGFDEYVYLFTK